MANTGTVGRETQKGKGVDPEVCADSEFPRFPSVSSMSTGGRVFLPERANGWLSPYASIQVHQALGGREGAALLPTAPTVVAGIKGF